MAMPQRASDSSFINELLRQPRDPPMVDAGRIVLRGHRPDDLADCAALWAHPEITRYVGGPRPSREEVWTKLLGHVGHWSMMGFGSWVVVDKACHRFVGEVGITDSKRDIDPPIGCIPEMSAVFHPWAYSNGLALDAVRAALDWFDARFGSMRTVCLIHEENVRSIRVVEKCGYKKWVSTSHQGAPTILFDRCVATAASRARPAP